MEAKIVELTKITVSNYSLEAKFKLIFDGVSSPEGCSKRIHAII